MEEIALSLDFQGFGIVKKDKIYFVENLLPNEKAIIEVVDDKGRFAFARVIKHIKKSKHRVMDYPLSYAPLSHLAYQQQLIHQVHITKETFEKITNINIHPSPIIYGDEAHYKNKITLHVQKEVFLRLGTYKAKSHILEPIKSHLLALPKINKVIEELNAIFNKHKLIDDALKQIQIRATDSILITFITNKPWKESIYFKGLNYNMVIKENNTFIPFKGSDYITLNFMDKTFKLYSDTFFQTNYEVAIKMFQRLKDDVDGVIVDAFAGAATIGILLAPYAKHVYSIESNKASYQSGLIAILDNHINNLTSIYGKVEDELFKLEFDTLIVDPPRAGLHQSLIEVIKMKHPKTIIYISCNLKTLTRDIKQLLHLYEIVEVIPVSMFPQTIETETVVILNKM